MRNLIACAFFFSCITAYAQTADTTKEEEWKKIYRAAQTKINDLVHTKLDVRFDFTKAWMYGKAWITLHPHFYPTDSLNLDAKGMNINEVSIIKAGKNIPLKYSYDSMNLRITLDRMYKANENYTIYINYVSKPNERKLEPNAVAGSKGLCFINPTGKEKDKPTQIWTQGETEYNSAWFPTIDKPNQKTTEEISMTVPAKYVTMSNGLLVSQKKNSDGTRTDTWKMDLPHAPYLFFMGVGDYAIIKDSYKGKEVSYYVEKEYVPVARKIFGLTPEMISFFSRITGVDYPWQKYAQITGKEYGGAMENTTSTLFSDFVQQDARELIDENRWEWVIAHELFHQWFGDYVTTESWSNITLNESFATLGSVLWDEYKYGEDAGNASNYGNLNGYLSDSSNVTKNLVRFYYNNPQDIFDAVSYPKGACILNMLRKYVGDSAFFKSLNLYLTTNKFKSAEAQNLRLAFEEVTGQDLNWFWNQWYYGSGHPKLDINYDYDTVNKTAKAYIKQIQPDKLFRLPFAIDVYEGSEKKRYKVWMDQRSDTFSFIVNSKPDLMNVDGDKILLCEKNDHKTLENFIYQYKYAGLYVDRSEAIAYAANKQGDPKALSFLTTALKDKYDVLRILALDKLNIDNDTVKQSVETIIIDLAKNDSKPLVRAKAIEVLGKYKKAEYKLLFMKALNDSSYTIAGNALQALSEIDSATALSEAKILSTRPAKGTLMNALIKFSDESKFDSLAAKFDKLSFGNPKFNMVQPFADFLSKVKNTDKLKNGIDMIVKFRDTIPQQYHSFTDPFINDVLNKMAEKKQAAGLAEQADYIKSKLPAEQQKQKKL
jgi:aminopeptidase N